jgi:hypothetical protein
VNAVDGAGETALHRAILGGSAASVELLLRVPGIDTNVCSAIGGTPLQYALCGHLSEIAMRLIACPQTNVNFRSEKCGPAIALAVHDRMKECVRALCARPELDVAGKAGMRGGAAPLVLAASLGDAESIECLLRCARMDVEDPDCGARTARVMANRLGLTDCVRLLTPPRKPAAGKGSEGKKKRDKIGFFERLRRRRVR